MDQFTKESLITLLGIIGIIIAGGILTVMLIGCEQNVTSTTSSSGGEAGDSVAAESESKTTDIPEPTAPAE